MHLFNFYNNSNVISINDTIYRIENLNQTQIIISSFYKFYFNVMAALYFVSYSIVYELAFPRCLIGIQTSSCDLSSVGLYFSPKSSKCSLWSNT